MHIPRQRAVALLVKAILALCSQAMAGGKSADVEVGNLNPVEVIKLPVLSASLYLSLCQPLVQVTHWSVFVILALVRLYPYVCATTVVA